MFECTCTSIHHRAISSHNDVDGFVRLNLMAFNVEVYFHNYTLQGYSCILWVWTCDPGCIVEQFMISISFPLYMINICKPPQSWRRWQLTEKEFCFFLNENSRNLSFPLYLPCAFLVLLSLSSSSLPCVSVVFGVWRQSGGTDPAAHLKFIWSPPRERGESLHFKEIASTFWSAWHTVKHTVHTHIYIYILTPSGKVSPALQPSASSPYYFNIHSRCFNIYVNIRCLNCNFDTCIFCFLF